MHVYSWLLFDADNTLWDFSAAEAAALKATLTGKGIDWSEEILADYRAINHQVWSDFEAGRLPKAHLRTIRFQRLLDRYRLTHAATELSASYREGLAQSRHLIPGARPLLERLAPNYRMGLITNGLKEVQRPRLAGTGFTSFFEFVVISDEIGVAKPQAAFFDHAYARMQGVDKARVLVIGDNPNADIKGGMAYGFDTCWLRHPGVADRRPFGETYRIRDLRELEQILT